MSLRPSCFAALAAVLVLGSACKKDEPRAGTGGGASAASAAPAPTLSAADFCERVFGAPKRHLAAHCTPEDQQKKQHAYLVGLASEALVRCTAELGPLVARGNVRLDAAAAERCGKRLEEASWKETLASPDIARFAECRALIAGTAAEGRACESTLECAQGSLCLRSGEGGTGGEGRCEKPGSGSPVTCSRSLLAALGTQRACGPGGYCPPERSPHPLGALVEEPETPDPAPSSSASALPPATAAPSASASAIASSPTWESRHIAHGSALRDAAEFGMIGLLNSGAGGDPNAWAEPEGIDAVGAPKRHRVKPPQVRMGATQVRGRLPPEVIQRIVRQNFGRFRLCYENGLRTDPKLAGRVSVKFEIGKDGSLTNAFKDATDLPDDIVVGCVVRAFKGLSFPSPEAGTVTVVYPITFSPGGEEENEHGAADAGARVDDAPCVASIAAGQGCSRRDSCAEGLTCRNHTCSTEPPAAAAGGPCSEEDDCPSGLYCRRPRTIKLEPRACAARKPDGAPCTSSVQCAGICVDHTCTGLCSAR